MVVLLRHVVEVGEGDEQRPAHVVALVENGLRLRESMGLRVLVKVLFLVKRELAEYFVGVLVFIRKRGDLGVGLQQHVRYDLHLGLDRLQPAVQRLDLRLKLVHHRVFWLLDCALFRDRLVFFRNRCYFLARILLPDLLVEVVAAVHREGRKTLGDVRHVGAVERARPPTLPVQLGRLFQYRFWHLFKFESPPASAIFSPIYRLLQFSQSANINRNLGFVK